MFIRRYKSEAFYPFLQLVSGGVRALSGVIVANLLSTLDYSELTKAGILFNYSLLFTLSVPNGSARLMPSSTEESVRIMNTNNFIFSIFSVFVALLIGNFTGFPFQENALLVTFVIVYTLFFSAQQNVLLNYLRSRMQIRELNIFLIIETGMIIISIMFIYSYLLYGLVIRWTLLSSLILFYLLKHIRLQRSTFKVIKHTLSIGLPIYLVGIIQPLWINSVASMGFRENLPKYISLFGIAMMIYNFGQMFFSGYSQIHYPKICLMIDRKDSLIQVYKFTAKMALKMFAVYALGLAVWWITGIELLQLILPNYVWGYPNLSLLVLFFLFQPIYLSNNIFNALGKQRIIFMSYFLGISMALIMVELIDFGFSKVFTMILISQIITAFSLIIFNIILIVEHLNSNNR